MPQQDLSSVNEICADPIGLSVSKNRIQAAREGRLAANSSPRSGSSSRLQDTKRDTSGNEIATSVLRELSGSGGWRAEREDVLICQGARVLLPRPCYTVCAQEKCCKMVREQARRLSEPDCVRLLRRRRRRRHQAMGPILGDLWGAGCERAHDSTSRTVGCWTRCPISSNISRPRSGAKHDRRSAYWSALSIAGLLVCLASALIPSASSVNTPPTAQTIEGK